MLVASGSAAAAGAAGATDWPTKPIRLVIPSSAGGAADLMGRTFATALATPLGQQFVIDNRPGAGGAIATEQVMRAEPDGYTLMVSGLPYHVLGPAMNPNVAYDPIRDFTHVAYFGGSPLVLVAHPSLGIKTFAELTALAASEKTGLDYVSPGFGTVGHVAVQYLVTRGHLNLRHVPYKGGAAAMVDLVAGHVKVGCVTLSTALEHIRTGQLVPLAVSTAQRLPEFPAVPTLAELGYGDMVVIAWFSLSAPAGLPAQIVQTLNRLVNEAMEQPDVHRNLERDAALTQPMTSEVFTAFMHSELEKWTPIVRTLAAGSR
jgi:tripartite-type tricarboxylate transporter receptor subunit TctC